MICETHFFRFDAHHLGGVWPTEKSCFRWGWHLFGGLVWSGWKGPRLGERAATFLNSVVPLIAKGNHIIQHMPKNAKHKCLNMEGDIFARTHTYIFKYNGPIVLQLVHYTFRAPGCHGRSVYNLCTAPAWGHQREFFLSGSEEDKKGATETSGKMLGWIWQQPWWNVWHLENACKK